MADNSRQVVPQRGSIGAVARRYRTVLSGLAVAVAALACAESAAAQRLENQVAVFAALDKVTARISKLTVPLGETVQFGSLKLTPRVCYSREPTEPPKTTTFVEVDELMLDGEQKRIFTGWMFAESPGLHAVEHPVFDVWLTSCAQPQAPRAAARGGAGAPASGAAGDEGAADPGRRRVRR